MRETFTYGTVGGALGNRRFYPEQNDCRDLPQHVVSTPHQEISTQIILTHKSHPGMIIIVIPTTLSTLTFYFHKVYFETPKKLCRRENLWYEKGILEPFLLISEVKHCTEIL